MLLEATYTCAYCGTANAVSVDATAGAHQEYVEDCQICCQPNLLRVTIDRAAGEAWIDAVPENA